MIQPQKNVCRHPWLEEAKNKFSPRASAFILDLLLPDSENKILLFLIPEACDYLLQQPQKTNIVDESFSLKKYGS